MDNYFINTLPRHNGNHGQDPSNTLIIQTIWNDDSIEISLFPSNCNDGFTGTISTSDLLVTATELEINFDDFMRENRVALTSENGLNNFTYHLEQVEGSFYWCKITEAGVKVTYGKVVVSHRDNIKDQIIMNALKANQMKSKTIEKQKEEFQLMLNDFNLMKISLDKCIEEKSNLENNLLTKFTALLNTKKKKIAELIHALENRSDAAEEYAADDTDSDLEYSSQKYDEIPMPSTSHRETDNSSIMIPKRIKTTKKSDTIVQQVQCTGSSESSDIYDVETQNLMDDM